MGNCNLDRICIKARCYPLHSILAILPNAPLCHRLTNQATVPATRTLLPQVQQQPRALQQASPAFLASGMDDEATDVATDLLALSQGRGEGSGRGGRPVTVAAAGNARPPPPPVPSDVVVARVPARGSTAPTSAKKKRGAGRTSAPAAAPAAKVWCSNPFPPCFLRSISLPLQSSIANPFHSPILSPILAQVAIAVQVQVSPTQATTACRQWSTCRNGK